MARAIRAARPADLPAVDALLAASYPRLLAPDYPGSVLVTALPRICRANPALLASGTYFLVFEGTTLVAVGGWTRAAPAGGAHAPGIGNVRHVAAHPGHLRRGHARALMAHVMRDAAGAGMSTLDCLSTRTAVPFYRSLGFAEHGPVDVPLGPGIVFPSIRMATALTPP